MSEQVATEQPTLEELAKIAKAPDWTKWGSIGDRQALLGVIVELQKKYRVRCVRIHEYRTDIYVQVPA